MSRNRGGTEIANRPLESVNPMNESSVSFRQGGLPLCISLDHYLSLKSLLTVIGLAIVVGSATANGGQTPLATIPTQELIFDLDYGSPPTEVELTPWLEYQVFDPNETQRTVLTFDTFDAQPGGSYDFRDAATPESTGFELARYLTDGITYDGLKIQYILMGFTIRSGSQQFDISVLDTFENWVFDGGFAQIIVPRQSANDLSGYKIDRIDVSLQTEVADEPVPNSSVFFRTSLQMTYSIYGTAIPEPSMLIFMLPGSLLLCRRP